MQKRVLYFLLLTILGLTCLVVTLHVHNSNMNQRLETDYWRWLKGATDVDLALALKQNPAVLRRYAEKATAAKALAEAQWGSSDPEFQAAYALSWALHKVDGDTTPERVGLLQEVMGCFTAQLKGFDLEHLETSDRSYPDAMEILRRLQSLKGEIPKVEKILPPDLRWQ